MRTHPILLRALEVDKAAALAAITEVTPLIMTTAVAFVTDELKRARRNGYESPVPDEAIAQILVRLLHSLVLFPDAPPVLTTDDDLAKFARASITPLLLAHTTTTP
jgi:hypothetical protein